MRAASLYVNQFIASEVRVTTIPSIWVRANLRVDKNDGFLCWEYFRTLSMHKLTTWNLLTFPFLDAYTLYLLHDLKYIKVSIEITE